MQGTATGVGTAMTETNKILITAVCGFLLGFLLEPLKLWISDKVAKTRLRRLCYREVYKIYSAMKTSLEFLKEPEERFTSSFGTKGKFAQKILGNINIGLLKYIEAQKADLLYQLDIGTLVVKIVHELEDAEDTKAINDLKSKAERVVGAVDHAVDSRQISGARLTIVKSQYDWDTRWRETTELDRSDEMRFGYRSDEIGKYKFRPIISLSLLRWRRLRSIWNSLQAK